MGYTREATERGRWQIVGSTDDPLLLMEDPTEDDFEAMMADVEAMLAPDDDVVSPSDEDLVQTEEDVHDLTAGSVDLGYRVTGTDQNSVVIPYT